MKSIIANANRYTDGTNVPGEDSFGRARIVVVGCGGAGNNTITRLHMLGGISGAQTLALNTDKQHLAITEADNKILIGRELTQGLGAGGDPERGYKAAEESRQEIKAVLDGAHLVFVTAGMGGGTGTGSASVVAEIAKAQGALVIGVVTLPFKMEGNPRQQKAEMGLNMLSSIADTVITLDNNKLLELVPNQPVNYAFSVADEVLAEMVKGLSETITTPSLVNLDFADIRAVMTSGGYAMIGVGESNTKNRAEEAVHEALKNKLLEVDYSHARGALVHVTGGPDMSLSEANMVGELICKQIGGEANVTWGARVDDNLRDSIRVMLILTGVTSPWISGREADGGKAGFGKSSFGEDKTPKQKGGINWAAFNITRIN
ncbi:MAG: cell division protein FtsZ [Candidatus Methanofastidiosa archaeon]|jgi:cell division protein FtsZ|nr:cell division protein FtsZ [Candidatus Methanofastidiosa archaeon]MDD4281066.1 cell division protein FtsZ [Candidatus Methanofastidiosa archaeon]